MNPNTILQDCKLALCDDKLAHMVPLPPVETSAVDEYSTIPRVISLHIKERQNNDHPKQPQYSNTPLVK